MKKRTTTGLAVCIVVSGEALCGGAVERRKKQRLVACTESTSAKKKRTKTRARGQGLDNWGRRRGGAQGVE